MNAADSNLLDGPAGTIGDRAARTRSPEILTTGRSPSAARRAGVTSSRRSLVQRKLPSLDCEVTPRAHLAQTAAMVVLVGLLAAGSTLGSRQLSGATDSQQLRQLIRAENQALVVADINQLDTLLASDFTGVDADGVTRSRQQLTAELGAGDLDVWSIRIVEFGASDPIEVQVKGSIATLTYESDVEVGSRPIKFQHDSTGADYHQLVRSRHMDTWVRFDGTWKHLRAETDAVPSTAR